MNYEEALEYIHSVSWKGSRPGLSRIAELCEKMGHPEDALRFVQREIRRGNTYDGILMDPPSYGRGPGGEVWKLEEQIYPLVAECVKLLSDDPLFFLINSYTTGLSPSVMQYVLGTLLPKNIGGSLSADEIGLPVTANGMVLPCGATGRWMADR